MDFETEKICLNQIISNKEEEFCAEDNIIIPDIKPDILSTINSSGNVYIYKREVANGRLKIDGGVQVNIMYLSDSSESSVRGIQSVIDFSQSFDLGTSTEPIDVDYSLNIKNIECKILNGRKLNIKTYINMSINVYSNTEKELVNSVNNIEGIQMISNQLRVNSLKGKGETVSIAKDTVNVDENVVDILDSSFCVRNKDIKISYNKVLSKADVIVDLLYLTENNDIRNVTAQIPVMGFIDINGISDNEICSTKYEVRNINIKPNNIEDKSIAIEIEFLITCCAYENKEINIIQDLYSPEKDVIMSQENICIIQDKNVIESEYNIRNEISIPELKSDKVYDIKIIPTILKQDIRNKGIHYEGELIVNVLYKSEVSDTIQLKSESIAFSNEISSDLISKNSNFNTEIQVSNRDYTCNQDNRINLNVDLKFIIDLYKKSNTNVVSSIEVKPFESEYRASSIVIYFVKEGDTLWKIAKKFRSTVDEIIQVNNIENPNKINVGDQLYIPKYVCNRVS